MKLVSLPLAAAAGLLATALSAQAALVGFAPQPAGDLEVGDAVSVTLETSGDIGPVFGFDLELTYDADVLSFTGVDYDPSFDIVPLPVNTPAEAPGASGETTLSFFTAGRFFLPMLSGAQTLATFNFEAVGLGTSDITAEPLSGSPLVTGESLTALFSGSVSTRVIVLQDDIDDPNPVPLPGSVLLLLGATGGLAGLRRFRRT